MPDPEFNSFNNAAENNNPWANAEMDVRSEAEAVSKEVEKTESNLADRIKNEMTLQEINELDIKNLPDNEYAAVKERIKYYRETGDAGPIKATANETVNVIKPATKTELPPKVQETKEKATKHSGFNRFINNAAEVVKDPKKLAVLGLTAMIATGAAVGGYQVGKSLNSNAETKPDKQIEKQEEAETEIGIKDGYGEKGMYLSENKPSELSFGSAVEVAEVCDGDECEMVKYTAENQVESMASYLAHLPKELQPEGFKGLTIAETEQKLESLSDKEYEEVQKEFNESIDHAFTRRIKVEGRRANVLMDKQDASGDTNYENMKAVKCETNENAIMLQLFWTKDNNANSPEIGSMVLKIIYDDDGNIIGGCIQPLDEVGNSVLVGLEEKQDSDPNPNPNPNPNPDPTPPNDAKDPEAIRRNMQTGDETTNRVAPSGPGKQEQRPDTSKDSYKEEQKNKQETTEKAKNQASESSSGGTVGDKIQNADQGESKHETRTEPQKTEVKQEQSAQEAQKKANEAAETVNKTEDKKITDSDAAAQLQNEIGG